MNLLSFFNRRASAPVARERLQILFAHERAVSGGSDLVALLQQEILAVITKHIPVERDKIQVKIERGDAVSMLEIDIEMPIPAPAPAAGSAPEKAAPEKAVAEKAVAEKPAPEKAAAEPSANAA
jgi:cell division topological specificity factor